MDDFFRFSKNLGLSVFLVHPTVVSVLLSASVESCFVSRMRDFLAAGLISVTLAYNPNYPACGPFIQIEESLRPALTAVVYRTVRQED